MCPVRGATSTAHSVRGHTKVSIHAPRAGRDYGPKTDLTNSTRFNPRAPCGARHVFVNGRGLHRLFQSTRPVRGATFVDEVRICALLVSIHSPRAGRDFAFWRRSSPWRVSIHAPRAGRDLWDASSVFALRVSIHAPRAGRDLLQGNARIVTVVSIHAPRAGRDRGAFSTMRGVCRFNPRAPCGARPSPRVRAGQAAGFNPRAPCGARPVDTCHECRYNAVSIHAPRAGRDRNLSRNLRRGSCFNPRAPCGARLPLHISFLYLSSFNPRAPCGARPLSRSVARSTFGFNPRAPCGARHLADVRKTLGLCFNPRAPCGARRRGTWAISEEDKFQSTRPMRGATFASSSVSR